MEPSVRHLNPNKFCIRNVQKFMYVLYSLSTSSSKNFQVEHYLNTIFGKGFLGFSIYKVVKKIDAIKNK